MSERGLVLAGTLLMAIGVAAGAFGAHGLRSVVTPQALETWQTAVLYQLVHGLAMLSLAGLAARQPSATLRLAGTFMLAGVLVFSGSLYILVATGIKWLGAITPIGGTALIVSWLLVAWTAIKRR